MQVRQIHWTLLPNPVSSHTSLTLNCNEWTGTKKFSHSHINLSFGEVAPAAYHSTSQWYTLPAHEDRLYFLFVSQMMWYYSSQEWIGSATWISIKAGLWRWMRREGKRRTRPAILHRSFTKHCTARIQSDESSFLEAGLSLLLLTLKITFYASPLRGRLD